MTMLPINTKPAIRNLTHNAFANSLLSAGIYTDETLAEFSVSIDDLLCESENAVFQKKGENYVVSEVDKYKIAKCFFYKEIKENSFFVDILLEYQKIHYAWSGFNLLFVNQIDMDYELKEQYVVKIGHPAQRNCFVKYNKDFVKEFRHIQAGNTPVRMKIDMKAGIITVKLTDSDKNQESYQITLSNHFLSCPLYFVIAIEPGENQYYNWLFMNNLQLIGYEDQFGYLLVDYYNKPRKNYRSYISDYMLEYMSVPNFALQDKQGFINTLEHIFRMKCYVITKIDQYYIKNCEEYGKLHHPHEMMIYGIDKVQKLVYMEGFLKEGVFGSVTMSFQDFRKAIADYLEDSVYLVRSFSHERPYTLNIEAMIRKFKEYIGGENSSQCTATWLSEEDGICGINIYQHFLNNTSLINSLAVDIRLAYTIWEHKKIMKERVEYLIQKKILVDKKIKDEMQDVYLLSVELKNGVIYNRIKKRKRLGAKRITEILEVLYKTEMQLYSKIVDTLISNISQDPVDI